MNLKALLAHPLKEDIPDEKKRVEASQKFQVTPSQHSRNARDSENVGVDAGVAAQRGGATDEDDVDLDREHDDTLSNVDLGNQPNASPSSSGPILSRILSSIFPSPSDEEEIQAYIPHYRVLPILSGITIAFCILLDIPGLTEDWYIRTDGPAVVAEKPNPPLLDAGIALSILCAVLASVCLVVRFLEKRVKTMTILCILFLSIHGKLTISFLTSFSLPLCSDTINIVALATFGAMENDYTFSQAFWMTLCSTIVSMFTNVTLIIDLVQTSDFKRSGSGLTRRQRSLVIIIIGLFCYLALGALANSFLLELTFVDGLYFTVVTVETIGFGDIVPTSSSSRVFVCFYSTLGVISFAFVVGYVRETVLEGLDFSYRRRLLAIQETRRAAHHRRRAENRWRHAIIWRLHERHLPVWIPKNTNDRRFLWSSLASCFLRTGWGIRSTAVKSILQGHHGHGMQLNLWALPQSQLEAAALEAGVPLDTLLPADFYDTYNQDVRHHTHSIHHHTLPSWLVVHPVYHPDEHVAEPLTHRRLGAMAGIVTRLGLAVYESSGNPLPNRYGVQDTSAATGQDVSRRSPGSFQSFPEDRDYRTDVADAEKAAYYTRSTLNWGWFLIFWMGGAAIFTATEGWTYGLSIYFCFISFATIGYGDLSPTTPAGRSFFVVWALVGVATMTIFISVVSKAYTSRYKGILGSDSFNRVVRQYRKRNRTKSSEEVHRIGTPTGVKFVLHETIGRMEIDVGEDELPPATAPADDSTTAAVASTSKPETHPHVEHTQRSLERLPHQILTETRSIQQYIQLNVDSKGHLTEVEKFVDEPIWSLIDDVMGGRESTECTKIDIFNDRESRQTLMMLGIEREFNELGRMTYSCVLTHSTCRIFERVSEHL
ncbi:hypothetical protein HD554DRAFT_813349 [Boletus coccyginus]|nr:hypothetical protein HD554DRAFT_813349 [Boletus coccyginus]